MKILSDNLTVYYILQIEFLISFFYKLDIL